MMQDIDSDEAYRKFKNISLGITLFYRIKIYFLKFKKIT